jgi:carbamoyltransferase
MRCIGFSGGVNLVHEKQLEQQFGHDGAAVLVEDGTVVAAIEEERLNRIKHSDKFPQQALRFCLAEGGLRPQDVDCFAFYATEAYCNALLHEMLGNHSSMPDARTVAQMRLQQTLQCGIDPERIRFIPHHVAHAMSAYRMSGLDESLVVAIDGQGDLLSGLVAIGKDSKLTTTETFPASQSLGLMYEYAIEFIGYGAFDEYKVMGLAPYGDPAVYRPLFQQLYELLPDGGYHLDLTRIRPCLAGHIEARRKGAPFTQQHKDFAAALQEALEQLALHILRYRKERSGQRNLCLAGGVAHNCTMNGKILESRLFERVFVQPAAHDAGCALGAALVACQDLGGPVKSKALTHVYWGSEASGAASIESELELWRYFLDFEHCENVEAETARLLADGYVVGWVQGRSEFGPRALGNRSILADPRPGENKERVNKMVKKREGYRPFAPSVLEENAHDIFELPDGVTSLPFMIFVVRVREEQRSLLGAITHVDGTARVQTVSRQTNEKYWRLIDEFRKLTGVPAVLNTSFNNNVEPIVDSVNDAIVCYLTTGLDYLVVGDFVARKRATSLDAWTCLLLSLPAYVIPERSSGGVLRDEPVDSGELTTTYNQSIHRKVSPQVYSILANARGNRTLGVLMEAAGIVIQSQQTDIVEEIKALWTERLVRLLPASPVAHYPHHRLADRQRTGLYGD